jgi:hypothetical protein
MQPDEPGTGGQAGASTRADVGQTCRFEPRAGTLLGHLAERRACPRSVDVVVDFA